MPLKTRDWQAEIALFRSCPRAAICAGFFLIGHWFGKPLLRQRLTEALDERDDVVAHGNHMLIGQMLDDEVAIGRKRLELAHERLTVHHAYAWDHFFDVHHQFIAELAIFGMCGHCNITQQRMHIVQDARRIMNLLHRADEVHWVVVKFERR